MGVPNLTRAAARVRAELLEVTSSEVELDLTDGAGKPGVETFVSHTTIRFRCRQPGAATFVDLVAERIDGAELNGAPLDVATWSSEAGLPLPELAANNTLVVVAACLYTNTGEGLHRFVDPVDDAVYLYSQFETADAKRMYTCFDQPDLKAPFTLTVVAPSSWQVVSNGRAEPARETTTGAQQVRFATTPPLATYVTALVAGPYHRVTDRHDGIDLGIYCRTSLAEHLDAAELFAITRQGLDWYHRAFDYRYPFDKYDQLFVPEFNAGAMENAGCVTFLEDYVFRSKVTDAAYERRAETILHEMAHMWFGDLVTMRWWDDLWLNESFASFVSVLCQAEATRWTSAWTTFANIEKTWAYRQDQLPSTHPIVADIPDVQAVQVNFDGITYAKGASVLKQLAAFVGLDAFLRAMRVYFKRYAYGNTTLAELLGVLAEESGRDLSEWSREWLESAGVNALRAELSVNDTGHYTSATLVQGPAEPGGTLRQHRLALGLYDTDDDGRLVRQARLELDMRGPRTAVPELIGRAQPALLLVNDDDLTYAKVRLDPRSLAAVVERLGDIEDPLARALCWAAAWDMTRDGEMAGRDYVALALGSLAAESEIGVVQSTLGKIRTVLDRYADPGWAPRGWQQLAEVADAALATAEPGSDLQLAWARAFAAAAQAPAHVATVRGLLDGSRTVPGLAVDTELRWSLLQALVAAGAVDEQAIDAEVVRDPTAAGQRRAATARALRPTAAAKAEAWHLATADTSLPNAINEAIIGGFHHPWQHALTAAYVDPYFALIRDVWETRSIELAQNIVVGLFPDTVTPETVAVADAFLADPSLPPALARLVSEGRDDLRRALRARARDAQT